MKASPGAAFYALTPGAWRDYVTLLHAPYTLWHVSYVVLGAAAAPSMHHGRLAGVLLAFFLAVGLSAHALDEYQGRPLSTRISDGRLLAIATSSLAGALAIGLFASLTISFWALPFVIFGGFIVLAYNLELFQAWFLDDRGTSLQPAKFVTIDVDAQHPMAQVRENRRAGQTHVSQADYRYVHVTNCAPTLLAGFS